MTNPLDIMVVDKQEEETAVVDVAIPIDNNIRKKEHGKFKKYQGRKRCWKDVRSKAITGTCCDRSTRGLYIYISLPLKKSTLQYTGQQRIKK